MNFVKYRNERYTYTIQYICCNHYVFIEQLQQNFNMLLPLLYI